MAPVKVNAGGGSESKPKKAELLKVAEVAAVRRRQVRALAANEGESAAASLFTDDDPQSSAYLRELSENSKTETVGKSDRKGETELKMMFGHSATSSLNRQFSSMGFSKTVSTLLKRPYYGAGLSLNNLLPDSFTLDFAVAAFLLANATYDFSSSMNFINTWGAWILLACECGFEWEVLPLHCLFLGTIL